MEFKNIFKASAISMALVLAGCGGDINISEGDIDNSTTDNSVDNSVITNPTTPTTPEPSTPDDSLPGEASSFLSNQVSTKIKDVFWEDVLIINSTVSQAKRTSYWMDIFTGKAKIYIFRYYTRYFYWCSNKITYRKLHNTGYIIS